MWERACSRMRCVIQQMGRLIRPLREQARSHKGIVAGRRSPITLIAGVIKDNPLESPPRLKETTSC
ncbi:hypothetical protein C0J26_05780 [Pseudomonas baetica]|nr:hypothetical protein C0J26_05780 [Pseudomonas baetica]